MKDLKDQIQALQNQLNQLNARLEEQAAPLTEPVEDIKETIKDQILNENRKERRKNLLYTGMGIAAGAGLTLLLVWYLEEIIAYGKYLDDTFAVLGIIVGALLVILLIFRNSLFYKIFGIAKASHEAIFTSLAQPLQNITKGFTTEATYQKIIEPNLSAINQGIRQIIAYMAYTRTRNMLFGLLFTFILGLFGFLGTYLLVRQNELIKEQSYLSEAARRSSLVFMMSNIMDKVDEELNRDTSISKDPYHPSRKLSDVTIGRIAALCQGMKPINYLENGELLDRPYSPERGQLLLSLLNVKLDSTETYQKIFDLTVFSGAELRTAVLNDAPLDGIILNNANLSGASMKNVRFINAELSDIDLTDANLSGAFLINSNLAAANLTKANLENASFEKGKFINVIFEETNCLNSDFTGSIFSNTENLKPLRKDHLFNPIKYEMLVFYFEKENVEKNLLKFENEKFISTKFNNCTFRNIEFQQHTLFREVSFKGTEIVNTNFRKSEFLAKKSIDSDIDTLFTKNRKYSVSFDSTFVVLSNFVDTRFISVSARKAQFVEVDFKDARFYNTDFTGAYFINSTFYRANFVRVKLDSVIVDRADWFDYLESNNVSGVDSLVSKYKIQPIHDTAFHIILKNEKSH